MGAAGGDSSSSSGGGTASVYRTCVAAVGPNGTAEETLECITMGLEAQTDDVATGLDVFFLIWAAALMFFMQAGFAVLCAGCVRRKNAQNTMLKNLLDACGAALGFWSVGYAFAYGGSNYGGPTTFIGNDNFFMMNMDSSTHDGNGGGGGEYANWLYQFAFAATSATVVAGTLAERCQMSAYLCYSVMLTGFVYPVIVHAVWSTNGVLSARAAAPLWDTGVIDFAGSGVVHVTGGFTALIATKILGARKGRFEDDRGNLVENPKKIKGHSVSLQVLGTFILWFAWYGFNAGSASSISSSQTSSVAAAAAVSTTLAAASGCISSLFGMAILAERRTGEILFDITAALNGCLAGLVSITGACAVVEPWAAVVIGGFGGIVYCAGSELLIRLRIDDAVDAIPVHLFGGLWGMLAVGLFASPQKLHDAYNRSDHVGWFYSWGRGSSDATLLGINVLGLLFILGWVLCTMLPFFFVLGYMGWFRSDPLEEVVGLDISYHGGSAYGGETTVNAEHLRAYMQRKDTLNANRRASHRPRESEASDFRDDSGTPPRPSAQHGAPLAPLPAAAAAQSTFAGTATQQQQQQSFLAHEGGQGRQQQQQQFAYAANNNGAAIMTVTNIAVDGSTRTVSEEDNRNSAAPAPRGTSSVPNSIYPPGEYENHQRRGAAPAPPTTSTREAGFQDEGQEGR